MQTQGAKYSSKDQTCTLRIYRNFEARFPNDHSANQTGGKLLGGEIFQQRYVPSGDHIRGLQHICWPMRVPKCKTNDCVCIKTKLIRYHLIQLWQCSQIFWQQRQQYLLVPVEDNGDYIHSDWKSPQINLPQEIQGPILEASKGQSRTAVVTQRGAFWGHQESTSNNTLGSAGKEHHRQWPN